MSGGSGRKGARRLIGGESNQTCQFDSLTIKVRRAKIKAKALIFGFLKSTDKKRYTRIRTEMKNNERCIQATAVENKAVPTYTLRYKAS